MMRRFYSVLILTVLLCGGLLAQQESDEKTKKELRKERREQRKEEQQAMEDTAKLALKDRDFTLRANTLQNRFGQMINVDNNVNFISIAGDEIAVQLGNIAPLGYNGVGGITYAGSIQDLDITDKKGGGFSARITFNSPNTINIASVYIDVYGENASARFVNGISKWTMRGFFERTSESLAFVSLNRTIGLIF